MSIRLFALCGIILLLGASVAFGQVGLVARYTFEGSYDDSSGNNLAGTAHGAATIVFDADRGSNVVSLDGTSGTYVDFGNDTLFNWRGGWTAAFWVKLRNWDEGWDTFLKKQNSFSFERDQSNEMLAFYHWPNWSATTVELTPDGSWHHVAATLSGTKQTIYLDGQLWKSVNNAGNFATTTSPVLLGSDGGAGRFIDAMFDEVQLHDVALTSKQIANLAGYIPPPDPLIAHYSFENGYMDSTDNQFDGTPNGAATIVFDPDRGSNVVSLDGTAGTYVNFGADTLFDWHGGWTAAFWVKLRNWDDGWDTFLKKGDAWTIERDVTAERLAFYHWPNFSPTGASFTNDGQWHHVAATLDGLQQRFYLDGQLVETAANAGSFATTTTPIILGSDGGTGRFIDAAFDEIYLYNQALSSSKIRELAGSPPVIGDVVLLNFNDNFINEAATGDTATPHGNVTFVDGLPGKGKAVRLTNTQVTDSSYLTFPDMVDLDITGNITIQGWFKYADTAVAQFKDPAYLVSKPEEQGKYNFRVWSSLANGSVSGGYIAPPSDWTVADPTGVASLESPGSFLDTWYHFTYQRDSVLRVVVTAIRDESGNLVDFAYSQSHPAYDLAQTSSLPLLIGRSRPVAANFFDGYLDEIRVSNTVVNTDLPPVILYPKYLSNPVFSQKIGNQDASASSYPVSAYIAVLGTPGGVASAKVRYHTVTDPYEKVAESDPRWQEVAMTGGAGDLYTGNIPQQAFGTVIDYYITASSTTGKTTTFGANADSTYDRFGVWRPQDKVLQLSFEETDLAFKDSTDYNHQLRKVGDWVLWDDPASQVEGSYCAYLPEGSFAMGEIISPFLAAEQYTVTAWIKPVPSKMPHNVYIISQTPGTPNAAMENNGPWWMPNYTFLQRYDRINNDMVHENREPGEFPWHGDRSYVQADTLGKWAHYLISCGPDSLVAQRNNEFDQPVERQVYKGPLGNGWEHPFVPIAPSLGRFRIGPVGAPDATPFYTGYIDKIEVYNYQTLPGNFAGPLVNVELESMEVPVEYNLSQNYPNPFNPSTMISYATPHSGQVELLIFNTLGQSVKTLVNENQDAGRYKVRWEGTNDRGVVLPTGVYFYQLRAGEFIKVNKMLLLK